MDTPAHCIEHELEIADIEKLKLILNDLRINEAFTLKKKRKTYIYNQMVKIDLDKVDNLGSFVELEIIKEENIMDALCVMDNFCQKFDITEEMRNVEGYAYLLFNKAKELKKTTKM